MSCRSISPIASTDATPFRRSKAGTTVSETKGVISLEDLPSTSTLAIITGSMSGLICMRIGVPTASSMEAVAVPILLFISITARSMLVPYSNSKITMLVFSCEILVTVCTPLALSSGLVTPVSTFSGLAPA